MIWVKFNLFTLFRILIFLPIFVITIGCGAKQAVSEYISGKDNATPPSSLINFIETADLNRVWKQDIGKGTDDLFAKIKPSSSKGTYLKKMSLSTTMGPGLLVDQSSLSI